MTARRLLMALAVIVLASCERVPTTTFVFERMPEETVALLIDHLSEERYEDILGVAVEHQHALLTVAEEPDPAVVLSLLEGSEESAAANFWSSFVAELPRPPTELEIVRAVPVRVGEMDFTVVDLEFPGEQVLRPLVLRRVPGTTWEVDLIASFAPAVARRLTAAVEALAATDEPEAKEVLAAWRQQRTSVLAAIEIKPVPGAFDEPLTRLAEVLAQSAATTVGS